MTEASFASEGASAPLEAPTLKDELKNLIVAALGLDYMSESKPGVPTGNNYQSVALGDETTVGFRSTRHEFLDRIDFAGKRVLDLGSNLGEVSRAARARGAALVDGFEYDPFFIEVANAINALNGVTRVSFYQRDITEPDAYTEPYDIVLAFSVFEYVHDVLGAIAQITDVLLLETHKLEDNLEAHYVAPVVAHFPHYELLGETEWATEFEQEGRALILFAKERAALEAALGRASAAPTSSLAAAMSPRIAPPVLVDVMRTSLAWRFFSTLDFDSSEELIEAVSGLDVDVAALGRHRDLRLGYSGWVYWLLFLKGYLQYQESGVIGEGNAYYDYIAGRYREETLDPGLAQELGVPLAALERVARRFRDLNHFQEIAAGRATGAYRPLPIRVLISDPPPPQALEVYEVGMDTPHRARLVDGWHRMFAAQLNGITELVAEITEEPRELPHVWGRIESFQFDGSRVRIGGWFLFPDDAADGVEVRVAGLPVAYGHTKPRPDVNDAFGRSVPPQPGFVVDAELFEFAELPADQEHVFEVLPMREWLPLGVMRVPYLPGMDEARSWPPEELAARVLDEREPERLGMRAAKCLWEMLTVIERHRALATFERVLDWGVRCGLLETFLPRFLPNAEVTAMSTDAEVVEWCRTSGRAGTFVTVDPQPPTHLAEGGFDLVLGLGTLAGIPPAHDREWLDELARLLEPGGLVAFTLSGELARLFVRDPAVERALERDGTAATKGTTLRTRAYIERQIGSRLQLLEYVVGGVDDHDDLVVARKRG